MKIFFILLLSSFLCLFPDVLNGGETDGTLVSYQLDMVKYNAISQLLPSCRGSLMTLGLVNEVVERLKITFPFVEIAAIDSQSLDFFSDLEARFDAVLVFLALEKDHEREARLCSIYNCLKPGGRGLVFVTPHGSRCLDDRIEQFLETTNWEYLHPRNLSLTEYRELFNKLGFSINDEAAYLCILDNSDTDDWICDRWKIPKKSRYQFLNDFERYLCSINPNYRLTIFNINGLLLEKAK